MPSSKLPLTHRVNSSWTPGHDQLLKSWLPFMPLCSLKDQRTPTCASREYSLLSPQSHTARALSVFHVTPLGRGQTKRQGGLRPRGQARGSRVLGPYVAHSSGQQPLVWGGEWGLQAGVHVRVCCAFSKLNAPRKHSHYPFPWPCSHWQREVRHF